MIKMTVTMAKYPKIIVVIALPLNCGAKNIERFISFPLLFWVLFWLLLPVLPWMFV